jgi:hypothetical protein
MHDEDKVTRTPAKPLKGAEADVGCIDLRSACALVPAILVGAIDEPPLSLIERARLRAGVPGVVQPDRGILPGRIESSPVG